MCSLTRSRTASGLISSPLRADNGKLTEAIGEDGVRQTFAVFARETEARLALFRQFTEGNDREVIEI